MRLAGLVIASAVFASVVVGCGDGNEPGRDTANDESTLATRTVESGEVEVKIEPVRIDADGAAFKLTFDTHSVELDQDVAGEATLEVDGRNWTGAAWDGDPPSGHHREGTLTFDAAGPARGTARLEIGGLPSPVVGTWTLR